ncbi:hypothetical protein PHLCEN_2v7296 [Hermanssonia centrifuga]|uniref:CHAT domain-containing protein n=1 Tax=Hermanssonia centrifuga TaxID=98765 RepID=A0A2R6NWZ0_9APHY|nr:hypothetical protein PHLCEN_2v7296 [Hermanssonia centrifuga]
MIGVTHVQDTQSDMLQTFLDLLMLFPDALNSLRTTQEWDSTTAVLIKFREGLPLLRPDNPLLPMRLVFIAHALMRRFQALGEIADIDDSIKYLDELVAIPSSSRFGDGFIDDGMPLQLTTAQSLCLLGDALMLRFERSKNVEDVDAAIEKYRIALTLISSYDPARHPMCLMPLGRALQLRFKEHQRKEDIDEAIQCQREAVSLSHIQPDEDESQIAKILAELAALLVDRYNAFHLIVDLEEAIENFQAALAPLPDNSEKQPGFLRNVAASLYLGFKATGQVEDLNRAIDHSRKAIACLESGNVPLDEGEILRSLAKSLDQLGGFLVDRYREVGQIVDLEEATESYEKALVFLPDNSEKQPGFLRNVAASLYMGFKATGQVENLNRAIDHSRKAIACLESGNMPLDEGKMLGFLAESLDQLGGFLVDRYREVGQIVDLEEATESYEKALVFLPDNSEKQPEFLNNLAVSLYVSFKATGQVEDLNRAIDHSRKAIACLESWTVDDVSSRIQIKRRMAVCLDTRADSEWSNQAEDMEGALRIRRELVALTEGKVGHHEDVLYLVNSLHSQWLQDPGQLCAFDEGLNQLRNVLQIYGHGRDRLVLLHQLAAHLLDRHRRYDAPEDLEEAIAYLRELLALTPGGHVRRAIYLSTLVDALCQRFRLFGRTDDIDDAVGSAREAVASARSCHSRHDLSICLSMLATSLYDKSGHCQSHNIFAESMTIWREVASLSPENLAAAYTLASFTSLRQVRLGQPSDDIEHLEKFLTEIPAGHPDKLLSVSALATVAVAQCRLSGGTKHQEEALNRCRESVAAYEQFPLGDDYCLSVLNLATAYRLNGNYEEAATRFEQAADLRYATPHYRLTAAEEWADSARQAGHSSSLRAHMKALELLDMCLTSTPTIDLQHQFLTKKTSTRAANAASCAIEKEELETAVQALEQGRALIWSRMRSYRHPIEKLQGLNASLAEEFKAVCQQLEHLNVSSESNPPRMTPIPTISATPHTAVGFDIKVTKNRQLLEDYERIISEIRQLVGFSSFLQVTPFPTLQTAARGGPVILVNVDENRSDAIILRATEKPLLVPLTGDLSAIVGKLSSRLVVVDRINRSRNEDRYDVPHHPKQFDMSNILQILWQEVCQPIALALQKMGHAEGSRVWWCPVGRLGALPLHAAGIYNNKGVLMEGFPDLYVSSYTPTLSSLIASRETAVKGGSGPRLLAVGQSNSLPKVKAEFFKLKSLFPSDVLRIRDGEGAESDKVLGHLRDHPWVHFACHGSLDTDSPFKSGFILHDKKLSLRDIIQAKLPNAELAFLAACHSAASESTSKTPDEVLTLAAAMQFCGFRSIVGTLWAMRDEDGPELAEKFYKHMLRNGLDNMDVRDSARAVHLATKSMREAGVPLHRWTTFVHVGI